MIQNELQYRLTQKQVENFNQAIEQFKKDPKEKHVHRLLYTAQLDGMVSQRDDLLAQIEEYEGKQ